MRHSHVRLVILITLGLLNCAAFAQIPPIPAATQRSIERIVGVTGIYDAGESVYKIRIPRNDIALRLPTQPAPASFLTESWIGFSPEIRGGGLLMGELQLLPEQVDPTASAILDAGLSITGLANTATFDQPHLMTINIVGTGAFEKLAAAIRKALDVRRDRLHRRTASTCSESAALTGFEFDFSPQSHH